MFVEITPAIKSIIQSASKVLSLSAVTSIVNVLLLLGIADIVDRELYGRFVLISSLLGMAGFFQGGGLSDSLIQTVARGYHGLYRKSIFISFLGSFIGLWLLTAIYYFSGVLVKINSNRALVIALLLWPFICSMNKWPYFLMGEKKYVKSKIFILVRSALPKLLTIIIMLKTSSLVAFISVYYGVMLICDCFFTALTFHFDVKNETIEKGIMRYAFHASLYKIIEPVAVNADRFLLGAFLPIEQIAIYDVAVRLWKEWIVLMRQVVGMLTPYFSVIQVLTKKMMKKILAITIAYSFVIIPLVLIVIPLLIHIIFKNKYDQSIPLLQILLYSTPLTFLDLMFKMFVVSKKDIKSYRNLYTYPNIFKLVAVVTCVPYFKLPGAILSLVVTQAVRLFVTFVSVKKYLPVAGGTK